MYAILEIAGKQFKVTEKEHVLTPKLDIQGETVTFDKILLIDNEDGNIEIGQPIIKGAKVTGKLIEQAKSDKILVFKKKRRKGYKKTKGHRQDYCKILIQKIVKE